MVMDPIVYLKLHPTVDKLSLEVIPILFYFLKVISCLINIEMLLPKLLIFNPWFVLLCRVLILEIVDW